MSVIISFTIPDRASADMLDKALRDRFGKRCDGFTARKDHIEVFMPDDVTDAEQVEIAQIITTHDYTLRTPEQLARIARDARLKELRALMQARQWDDPVLEWLALEVSVIKERLGITE